MTPGCPYDGLAPANLRFCEADVCGWVTQPANTWSNVGFLVAAAVIAVAARRHGDRRAGLLAPLAVATGLASAAFHATSTFVAQALDQGAMLLESALFVVLGLARLRPGWPARRLGAIYAAIAAPSVGVLAVVQTSGIALFVGHVVAFLAIELVVYRRRPRATYRWMIAAGVTFAVSWGLWWLDRLGTICDPANHVFTAHAAWHLLGAVQFYLWYRYYRDVTSV